MFLDFLRAIKFLTPPQSPTTYGATLEVRTATPDDLPPGCAWIETETIDQAVSAIHQRIVNGDSSSAIVMVPQTENCVAARRFFAQSAGRLESPTWDCQSEDRPLSKESLLAQFKAAVHAPEAFAVKEKLKPRPYASADYSAAVDEIKQWGQGFLTHMEAHRFNFFTQSWPHYNASQTSFDIHDDGGYIALGGPPPSERGLRFQLPWYGDNSFLFDGDQLQLLPLKSWSENLMLYKPKGNLVTAWDPPPGAALLLGGIDPKKAYSSPHAAKGIRYASKPEARVISTFDVFVR